MGERTDRDFIDMIETTDELGRPMWVPSESPAHPVHHSGVNVDGGQVTDAGRPVSQIPQERFSSRRDDADEMAEMIRSIRDLEAGRSSLPVFAEPDGRIVTDKPGQHQNPVSTVPQERFAAAPPADLAAIRQLDPNGVCDWHWHDTARGWSFTLRPRVFNDRDEYRFLARREPHRRNEWFAYCLHPNLDHLVGHRHHLQQLDGNTVVCLREGFRGHPTLRDLHGALSKWCLYIEFVRRDLAAPFSV